MSSNFSSTNGSFMWLSLAGTWVCKFCERGLALKLVFDLNPPIHEEIVYLILTTYLSILNLTRFYLSFALKERKKERKKRI